MGQVPVICANCGVEYFKSIHKYNESIKLGHKGHYCSRTCADKRWQPYTTIKCAECGTSFTRASKKLRYQTNVLGMTEFFCAHQCVMDYKSNLCREEAMNSKAKICKKCGKQKNILEFPKRGYTTRGVCKTCRTLRVKAWLKNGGSESKRASNAKRKAQKKNTEIGPVSYQAIKMRDNDICYLCGESTIGHNIEFDHVIPLSKGGSHTEDNIKVTHANCNRKKNDKMIHELDWVRKGLAVYG